MTRSTQILLDPYNHHAAATIFFDFFQIPRQKCDINLLHTILLHFSNLPYENLSKIVKYSDHFDAPERIRMPEEVINDYIDHRLGGTCFSLSFLLESILVNQGFICYPVIAHMSRMPNSHCALVVLMDNQSLFVDPGYLLNHPMELNKDKMRVYRTTHTGVEVVFNKQNENFDLYTFNAQQLKFRYTFQNKPLSLEAFLQHWHASFQWSGMRDICLSQVRQDGMVYVNGDYLQVQNTLGKQKGRVADIHKLVNEHFHISAEWVEKAHAALPLITSRGQKLGYYRKKGQANETE